jgi:serine/threonine-protein kinase
VICPACLRSYADPDVLFCGHDGARLVEAPALKEAIVHPTGELGAIVADRYAIQGFVGAGGMARVYVAEDTTSGQRVAVKILRRDQISNRLARERFLREIEIARAIDHPNVVRIVDAGERADRSPFLVLEFLRGESVGEVLSREPYYLPERFALMLAKQASLGLGAAHAAGVIHRDVKPDNLFIGADGVLKVVDFGMAKLKEGVVTATGMTVGTVPYMAPEQALADNVDARTDVYGLGVTLFHMLAGCLPFDTDRDPLLVAQHLYVAPPAPTSIRPSLDPRVDRVVLTAMRKRPENRYPSMAALAADLERVLGERPGELQAPPLQIEPDLYEPANPMSRTAARFLRSLVS